LTTAAAAINKKVMRIILSQLIHMKEAHEREEVAREWVFPMFTLYF